MRRSVAAAALGLGVGGAACGGATERDPPGQPLKDSGARSGTSADTGTSETSADTGSEQMVSPEGAATPDAGQGSRHDAGEPPPPVPPLPPPLPPQ